MQKFKIKIFNLRILTLSSIIFIMLKENAITDKKKPNEIVTWDEKYSVGIELINGQHHELIVLTNQLYNACFENDDKLHTAFKKAMSSLVGYVRFHFEAELKILNAVNYPDYLKHKKMHEDLVRDILEAVKDYNEGKKFVPNNLVRTLKDWIFSHIAVYDKMYSIYVMNQIKTGALSIKALKDIEIAAVN